MLHLRVSIGGGCKLTIVRADDGVRWERICGGERRGRGRGSSLKGRCNRAKERGVRLLTGLKFADGLQQNRRRMGDGRYLPWSSASALAIRTVAQHSVMVERARAAMNRLGIGQNSLTDQAHHVGFCRVSSGETAGKPTNCSCICDSPAIHVIAMEYVLSPIRI